MMVVMVCAWGHSLVDIFVVVEKAEIKAMTNGGVILMVIVNVYML